jgi:hypothetical protein
LRSTACQHGERCNALTDLESSDTSADGINDARDFVTGNERYLWRKGVVAGQRSEVDLKPARSPVQE